MPSVVYTKKPRHPATRNRPLGTTPPTPPAPPTLPTPPTPPTPSPAGTNFRIPPAVYASTLLLVLIEFNIFAFKTKIKKKIYIYRNHK